MISPSRLARRSLTLWSHRIHALPVVVLMPHSRCNCRCVMCDIWKANDSKQELSAEDIAPHLAAFDRLGVGSVVLSGGEPLLHSNLWTLCRLLRQRGVRIALLSTGMTLAQHAADVASWCDEVIVSLDGSRPVHDRVRGIDGAFDKLAGGVAALRAIEPAFRITGRSVVQRLNRGDLRGIVAAAREIGLDRISFLAADLTSAAFNRPIRWDDRRAAEVGLDPGQAAELEAAIEEMIAACAEDFAGGFIAESPQAFRRIGRHFLAANGLAEPEPRRCNAPWVSTVIEADGTVRPCFFHAPLGNIRETPLDSILNGDEAVAFRRRLDVTRDPICRDCVCTLNLPPWREGAR